MHFTNTSGMQNALKKSSYHHKLNHFKIYSLEKRKKVLDLKFFYKLVTNKIGCPMLLSKIAGFNEVPTFNNHSLLPTPANNCLRSEFLKLSSN